MPCYSELYKPYETPCTKSYSEAEVVKRENCDANSKWRPFPLKVKVAIKTFGKVQLLLWNWRCRWLTFNLSFALAQSACQRILGQDTVYKCVSQWVIYTSCIKWFQSSSRLEKRFIRTSPFTMQAVGNCSNMLAIKATILRFLMPEMSACQTFQACLAEALV